MQTLRFTTLFLALAILAACGGSQNAMPQNATALAKAHQASGSYDAILYVIFGGAVFMLTYPDGVEIGQLNMPRIVFDGGMCPDPVNGIVYMNNDGTLFEYPYGSKDSIGQISRPGDYGASSCAADPKSGNLAVAYVEAGNSTYIGVYPNGSGTPVKYVDRKMMYFSRVGYDDQGNLFADGFTKDDKFLLAELPKGSSSFTNISLNLSIIPGPVQWDGKYITVEQEGARKTAATIYQIAISGANGTVVGKTTLHRHWRRTWITGNSVIASGTDKFHNAVGFFSYPSGGKPNRVIDDLLPPKDNFVLYAGVATGPSRSRTRH